ncbi:MAG: DUF3025 domain-containing protein [Pseudomonadota bacterium]|nr:DUF3025 domain-containing protein [Pseudomonadota bacterium]
MNEIIKRLSTWPFFAPIWPVLAKFQHLEHLPSLKELNAKLAVKDITFVEQSAKSDNFNAGYEPRIYLQGEVQTRDQSWHDFFNACVWQQFPQTKKLINKLQFQLQQQRYPSKQRLPAENMLTLFDENGVVVIAKNPELLALIQQHSWHELFWQRRDEVQQQLQIYVIGHGLYEKALHPYIGLTAKALLLVDYGNQSIDQLVSNYISTMSAELKPSMLNPLPILGIPGWWSDNTNEAFYTNKAYFREKPTIFIPELYSVS